MFTAFENSEKLIVNGRINKYYLLDNFYHLTDKEITKLYNHLNKYNSLKYKKLKFFRIVLDEDIDDRYEVIDLVVSPSVINTCERVYTEKEIEFYIEEDLGYKIRKRLVGRIIK